MSDSEIPWTVAGQTPLSSTISRNLLNFMSIELVILSNHLILCHPLLLCPSISPSIRVFSNELALHIKWPNYWSCSLNPSNEYWRLISFRIDWFDLFAVQGTFNSSALSHRYGSTLTSVHDYWKNHSFDLGDLYVIACLHIHPILSNEKGFG